MCSKRAESFLHLIKTVQERYRNYNFRLYTHQITGLNVNIFFLYLLQC